MLHIVLAALFVAMVMGEGCCPPDAWEGEVDLTVGYSEDKNQHLTKGVLTLHVNNSLGMIAIEEELLVDGSKIKLKVIQDYNKKTEYTLIGGKCIKKPLESSIPRCLPENSTLVNRTYIGAGSENVAVKVYRFNVGDIETDFTVTACDCIPVVAILSGTLADEQVSVLEVLVYSGITVGVEDPSVFNIPAICKKAEMSTGYFSIMSRWRRSVFN
ncbi:hypothetical protein CHS0354_025964 [Potamilus streckersoni]|uniref:Uncharacterized protein n=1 Tax=Potamilus streckersoni TaxID=2493646 RepID=A0AAE0W600_9BIVA|nr:hypothetical protein CHS0354_025964 [Potamilus streckersoni]